MTETIYADILFMINFSMDVLSLYIAAKMTSQKVHARRLFAGGVLGGIYGIVSLFITGGILVTLPLSIIVGAVVVTIGLGCASGRNFIVSCVLFFVAGGTLSGVMTAVISITGRIDSSGVPDLSPRSFVLCAGVSVILTLFTGKIFSFNGHEQTVEIIVADGHGEFRGTALVDSGNLVREPISGRPCIVIRASDVKEIIPKDLCHAVYENTVDLSQLSRETLMRTRLVPTKGIGESKILLAYRPKLIEIKDKGKVKQADAFLLIDNVNEKEKYGDAVAIVPASIL